MGKVDATALNSLSEKIGGLPARSTLTPYELVGNLAPAIREAMARGQDLAAIAKLLAADGVRLAPSTIANYLRRARRERALPPSKTRKESAPSTTEESSAPPAPARVQSLLERVPRVDAGLEPPNGRFELVQDSEV